MVEKSSWIDTLKELRECLQDKRFDRALEHCKALQQVDDIPQSLLPVLEEISVKCELHRENFDTVVKSSSSPALKAYAYYRLHQYEKAKAAAADAAVDDDDVLAQHVLAQSLYRLHDSKAARDKYQRLLQSTLVDDEEWVEMQTNALAVALSNAVPYVEQDNNNNVDWIKAESTAVNEATCDLIYNLASYQLLTASSSSSSSKNPRRLLQEARDARLASLEAQGMSKDEIASDVSAMNVQLDEWSLEFQGLPSSPIDESASKTSLAPSVESIHAVNRATTSLPQELPTNNWTALQQRLYYYKRAILQLNAGQLKESRETCQLLEKSLSGKKKTAAPPVCSEKEQAWWKTRIRVLEAHVLKLQSKTDQAIALLETQLESLRMMEESCSMMDHATAHAQLHLAHVKGEDSTPQQMVQVLKALPESLQQKMAVTATLIALYQQLGQTLESSSLLEQSEVSEMADFLLSQGKFEEAAELYESSGDKAKLVVALSYVDPMRAQQVWDELGVNDEELSSTVLNGEELEALELPRFKSKTTIQHAIGVSEEATKKKRSQESVMKRRARKREEYVKEKGLQGKQADPERWLPKHERSYYARRRRHHNKKGAQGGISERDAAKLDVAARKEGGGAFDSGPSTAHMTVVGGPKRGGKRR